MKHRRKHDRLQRRRRTGRDQRRDRVGRIVEPVRDRERDRERNGDHKPSIHEPTLGRRTSERRAFAFTRSVGVFGPGRATRQNNGGQRAARAVAGRFRGSSGTGSVAAISSRAVTDRSCLMNDPG